MESKKINQLATELAPDLSDLTIIGDPTTGISKKITLSQMASLFTGTVEEYATLAAFPLVGVADTIYIALDTNIIYRYDTSLSAYVILSPNIINSLVFSDANGFDGTITLVGSVATLSITTALTLGSVPFIGASGALIQDNANLFFDDTNNRLGIATALPTTPLDVFGSGIIGRLNATSTNNAYLGFASNGTNKWSAGNVQSDHRFRIFSEANSAELITILQTGEFGIGIANPLTKLHIDGGATALIANLDANVSVAKSLSFRSDNSNRINLEVSGTESGSDAGANFFIRRYSDAGALIDTPLTITRSTGAISLATALSGTTAIFSGNVGVGATSLNISGYAGKTLTIGNGTQSENAIEIYSSTSVDDILGDISCYNAASTDADKRLSIIRVNRVGANNSGSMSFFIKNAGTFVNALSIASTGTATFSGEIKSGDSITLGAAAVGGFWTWGASNSFLVAGTGKALNLNPNGSSGSTGISIATTGAATFSSSATFAGYVGINGATSSNPLTVKVDTNLQFRVDQYLGTTNLASINATASAYAGMKIDGTTIELNSQSGGAVLIGTLSNVGQKLRIYQATGGNWNIKLIQNNSSSINYQEFLTTTDGDATNTARGSITYNGTNVLFNGTSDYRLKDDLKEFNGINIINQLKTYDFNWIEAGKRDFGMMAHELQEILPNYVTGQKDELNNDGSIKPQGVDYSKIVPILIKGIQELKAEIEILKAK